MKKRGRPPISGKTMERRLTFRVTTTQKERWRAEAATSGESLSAWIRRTANEEARRVLGSEHPLVRSVFGETA